tara:strand:+ start:179 stop:475 length:297 start_codon:yes stop_codon:yes gene_type:complete
MAVLVSDFAIAQYNYSNNIETGMCPLLIEWSCRKLGDYKGFSITINTHYLKFIKVGYKTKPVDNEWSAEELAVAPFNEIYSDAVIVWGGEMLEELGRF